MWHEPKGCQNPPQQQRPGELALHETRAGCSSNRARHAPVGPSGSKSASCTRDTVGGRTSLACRDWSEQLATETLEALGLGFSCVGR
jgi:hypothetical protein